MRPSPATGAMASSTSAISSSLAPAASARPVLHSRHIGDDPMATHAPTCSKAAVLTSSADAVAGSSPSPASLVTKPSSIIASLRSVSWNLTVRPCRLCSRGFLEPGTHPREFLVLSLVVVLELVQDNMSHSVAGLDHQVLIKRADSVGPAVRHLQPLAKVRQLLGQVRVLDQRGALHCVNAPVRGDQFMYRLASVKHPYRGPLDFRLCVGRPRAGEHAHVWNAHLRDRLHRDAAHGRHPATVEDLGAGLVHLGPPGTIQPDSVAAELGLERVGVESTKLLVGQPVGQAERVVADADGA